MIRVGFIGRTKALYNTISLIKSSEKFKICFIWTCKDENYYNFDWKNFEKIAKELNCPFVKNSEIKINSKCFDADLVISLNFINMIPKAFIDKFKYGILNAHLGDLPRYKGNACPNWAILNNEKEIALSIHKMNEKLDDGPIIIKNKYKLNPNTYIGDIYDWFDDQAPILLYEGVNKIINGYHPKSQKGRSLRTFPRKPEDSKLNFSADIDWNYRLIRASSKPFNGAFCFLNNTDCKITIFRAIPININYDFSAVSGQIIEVFENDLSFLVSIGNRILKITNYSINGLSTQNSFLIISKSMRNRLT